MDDYMEAARHYRLSLSIISKAQRSISQDEFNGHLDDFISSYRRYVEVFFYKDIFPVWNILQLCCNRQENVYSAHGILINVGLSESSLIRSLLLVTFLNRTSPSVIDIERPLLPYLLECARKTRLTLFGMKFTECFQLDVIKWTGNESDSLRVFLKYGGGFDMPRNQFLQVLRNILCRLVEACKSSGSWDPVTLRKLSDPPDLDPEAMNKVNGLKLCFQMLVEEAHNPYTICSERAISEVSSAVDIPRGETLVEFYDSLYNGENYGENTVGSLMHMCKVAVRRQLHANYSLPSGVQDLELPLTLKEYISEVAED